MWKFLLSPAAEDLRDESGVLSAWHVIWHASNTGGLVCAGDCRSCGFPVYSEGQSFSMNFHISFPLSILLLGTLMVLGLGPCHLLICSLPEDWGRLDNLLRDFSKAVLFYAPCTYDYICIPPGWPGLMSASVNCCPTVINIFVIPGWLADTTFHHWANQSFGS